MDGETRVTKRGQATGITYGKLFGKNFSLSIPGTSRGEYFTFNNCYMIKDEDYQRPFFKAGDSGSGVFLIKNKRQFKPLGIAFAHDPIQQSTAVCKIKPIITNFALSLYREDDEMDE